MLESREEMIARLVIQEGLLEETADILLAFFCQRKTISNTVVLFGGMAHSFIPKDLKCLLNF